MATATYWSVVRDNPGFRRLWLAQLGSNAGDWFNDVAVLGLILALTGSPSAAGYFIIAAQIPPALLSPFAGVLVDRFDRRWVMVLSDVARAVLALGFLFVRSADMVWLIYIITAVLRSLSAFFYPAQNAAIPNLVRRHELVAANGVSNATWGTMLAVGSALGGLVSATLGRDAAFVINSLSFLSSAVFIASIRERLAEGQATQRPATAGLQELREGISYVRQNLAVFVFLLVKTGWGLGAGVILLLSVFATNVFGAGDDGIGWLYGARGVGVFLGPYLAAPLVGNSLHRMRWSVAVGYVVTGVGYILFSFSTGLLAAAPFVMFAHLGSGATWVMSSTMLQQLVPDRLRGRVFALDNALVTLAIAASTWLVGQTIPIFGPRPVGVAVASVSIVTALGWVVMLLRTNGRLSDRAPAEVQGD